jgi:hypothetical protein
MIHLPPRLKTNKNGRNEGNYQILIIKIRIILTNLFFYPKYSRTINKSGLQRLEIKIVNKFSAPLHVENWVSPHKILEVLMPLL